MKKWIIILSCIFIVGCEEKKPVQNTIDAIGESKDSVVKLQIANMFKEAEMKWAMGYTEKCILVTELASGSEASGSICMENSEFYTENIEYKGYKCSGKKENITCVGGQND